MAVRAFSFGVRLREKGRTVSVRALDTAPSRYVVEDAREGCETRRRVHPSLGEAIEDTARIWRMRLH